MRPSILVVSKPIVPPWNDSSKNLVKDLVLVGTRFTYHVLTTAGATLAEDVIAEPIYRGHGEHTPAVLQNLRVLGRLLKRDETALTHFFFAPNPKTALAARLALGLRPRRTVQTVCSTPSRFDQSSKVLFAGKVVVLSRHAQRSFIQAGIAEERLVRIPPGIQIPPLPSSGEREEARRRQGLPSGLPLVIYPGDYQFSRAADVFARAILRLRDLPAFFIFACRIKQEISRREEERIRSMLAEEGLLDRVKMVREVPDMLDLLTACDLCVLPAESLYAKMDLPLVLLEAMALGLPVIVADRPPLVEILEGEGGLSVPPLDPEALASTIRGLLTAPDRLRHLGANARAAACDRYDIRRVSELYEALYQEILEREG